MRQALAVRLFSTACTAGIAFFSISSFSKLITAAVSSVPARSGEPVSKSATSSI
jgi:hypothetical protein